ncbi:2-oxo-4-hydroxy-4-carboxy-5-ureidoimidazoline decarboxylase [Actinokineospora xionganensis]|uniref:2-oxo-4-hydroxy-4-carboxy-5-ureidoimidazoline decarboxylase n=1 Tax=Actinokineospora xionganensis TaxID=2684470 RepID=A0ABR7L0B6_9PSEU|nr:2-oxo-4-hydroxy-4-carboxy-5-ureidoimidazoline decarboxylase [Actinokineospora xionganensis]MBC6446126.1 2-oxo-4-hydroxy-4-carboxy-5-ureidoimidazoline decarboxylase [Actinokineospora xionganensis]
MTATPGLTWLNGLAPEDAERELRTCCASRAWAGKVAAGRPYDTLSAAAHAADTALDDLGWADLEEALAAHPRIGDRAGGTDREAAWSRGEQSAASRAASQTLKDVAEGNRAYEDRFGHVFLICATGLAAEEILANLRARLGNDEATERGVVHAELRKITHLRLRKLVTIP